MRRVNISFKRFLALLSARNKEFLRDRSSLSWNILMPVLILAGFAFAFSNNDIEFYKVGIANSNQNNIAVNHFRETQHIQFIPVDHLEQAIIKVQRHQLDLLVDAGANRYWINNESPKGYLVERIMLASTGDSLQKQTVSGREIRYVDWVIPGILAMNLMFSSLYGVGYVIVRYRKNGMLKRLKATPVTAFEYLSAQVISRLILIMTILTFIFYSTNYFIGYAMFGSHLNLFLVFAIGTVSMISLSLVIAARTGSEETAGGLLNLVSWPMMFLSGVWFSLEGTNPFVQKVAEIFPLTHVTAAARAIMIDGAGLMDISYHLVILLIQTAVFMIIGAISFRWE